MPKNKITFLLFLMVFWYSAAGQKDSVFSFDHYLDSVLRHHPVAVQAKLVQTIGEAKIRKAKGLLDPKAQADIGQKYFDDKKYYSVIDAGFKFPTWLGVDFKAGYEQNIGGNVNPQAETPISGLIYAGVSVPVGKGLFIDERRAAIQKAKIFMESTDVQQRQILNGLLLEASIAYWDWYEAFNTFKVYEEAYTTATERFEAVKKEAYAGNRPFVDTLEAGIQVQNRLIGLKEAELNFKNAQAGVSVFLWLDGEIPIALSNALRPPLVEDMSPVIFEEDYSIHIDTMIQNHPEFRMYDFKISTLDVERRWAAEQLKPELNLNYNPITEATGEGLGPNLSINNYKWGLTFSMPILLRKERGNLQLTKVKMTETKLDQRNKFQQLKYKAITAINQWEVSFDQLTIYRNTVNDYKRLFESEVQLFRNGESTLFMVNSRQLGYINTQKKYIELITKNYKAEVKTQYSLGIIWDEVQK